MKGDALLLHPRDEHVGRVARQRRERKTRIAAEKAFPTQLMGGIDIGEIAAPAAGNPDFFARIARMVDHQHLAATLARLDTGHHAGGTGSQDDHVEIGHGHLLCRLRTARP